MFGKLSESLDELSELGVEYEILFLDASDEALIKRYKETRRIHPLSGGGRIIDGVMRERRLLEAVKEKATKTINTSTLSATQLREQDNSYVRREVGVWQYGGACCFVWI